MKVCWVNWVEPRDFEISPHVGLAWGFLFPTPAQNGEPAPPDRNSSTLSVF